MCRWLVYVSPTEECLLEDVLVTPKHGIAKQVNEHYLPGLTPAHPHDSDEVDEGAERDCALNIDGMGLVWYGYAQANFIKGCDGPRPSFYKSISPALNDFNFRNICRNTETKLLFAHVRATSGSAVAQVNCHPFVFGRQSFMHNGTTEDFCEIRRSLCGLLDKDSFANVQGSSDTEHLAALYMTLLTNGRGKSSWDKKYSCEEILEALTETIGTVIRLQQEELGDAARPNSFNFAVADGHRFVCVRFRNHKTQRPPSLYWSTTAGVTLNRKYPGHPEGWANTAAIRKSSQHGKHLIVASEPTTYKEAEWKLIGNNCYLWADENGKIKTDLMRYDESWNVHDDDDEYVMVQKTRSIPR